MLNGSPVVGNGEGSSSHQDNTNTDPGDLSDTDNPVLAHDREQLTLEGDFLSDSPLSPSVPFVYDHVSC